MNPAELLRRVAACGYRVTLTPDGPRLVPARSECVMPARLLADLKRHRSAVVAYLSECEVCGRDVSDDEDRERLAGPLFCSEGDSKAVTDGLGVFHPATHRCPYKP